LIAAEQSSAPCYGLESHPFVYRLAKAKLAYRSSVELYEERCRQILKLARSVRGRTASYPPLIQKCYNQDALASLDCLKSAWLKLNDGSPESELGWLTLVSILRKTSHAGTAPWQYVLPGRSKRVPPIPELAFITNSQMVAQDMRALNHVRGPHSVLIRGDARSCEGIEDNSVNLVITSPP